MHQERLHRLRPLRYEGCCDVVGPRRLALGHRMFHAVREVLHGIIIH